jgi:hypothetical protein
MWRKNLALASAEILSTPQFVEKSLTMGLRFSAELVS